MTQLVAKAIGARIALARDEAGLTQEDVGDLATFSKRSLQDYEAGVTIPYKHMQEISGLLNRPVPWFLHGDPEPAEDVLPELVAGRLESLEADVAEVVRLVTEALELLRASLPQAAGDPPVLERDSGERP